jgi:hypothetical protein
MEACMQLSPVILIYQKTSCRMRLDKLRSMNWWTCKSHIDISNGNFQCVMCRVQYIVSNSKHIGKHAKHEWNVIYFTFFKYYCISPIPGEISFTQLQQSCTLYSLYPFYSYKPSDHWMNARQKIASLLGIKSVPVRVNIFGRHNWRCPIGMSLRYTHARQITADGVT